MQKPLRGASEGQDGRRCTSHVEEEIGTLFYFPLLGHGGFTAFVSDSIRAAWLTGGNIVHSVTVLRSGKGARLHGSNVAFHRQFDRTGAIHEVLGELRRLRIKPEYLTCNTRIWPSQSTPAPMPMVGMESSCEIVLASAAGMASSTIRPAPAASSSFRVFAYLLRCLLLATLHARNRRAGSPTAA